MSSRNVFLHLAVFMFMGSASIVTMGYAWYTSAVKRVKRRNVWCMNDENLTFLHQDVHNEQDNVAEIDILCTHCGPGYMLPMGPISGVPYRE